MADRKQDSEDGYCKLLKPKVSEPAVTSELKSALIAAEQSRDLAIRPLLIVIKMVVTDRHGVKFSCRPMKLAIFGGLFASLVVQEQVLCRKLYHADGSIIHSQIVMPGRLRQRFRHFRGSGNRR